MPSIIRGQKISKAKFEVSKSLRQQMTPEEQILWEHLRKNGLGGLHFRRQQSDRRIYCGFLLSFRQFNRGSGWGSPSVSD